MYAFLGVWTNRDAYKKCFDSCNIFLEYKEKAYFQRDLELISIKSYGFWNGKNHSKAKNLNLILQIKKSCCINQSNYKLESIVSILESSTKSE